MNKKAEEQLSLFPLTIYKYLLLISPPPEAIQRIKIIKNIFGEDYKSRHALSSVAHLSLCGFNSDESNEEFIERIIKIVVSKFSAFDVKLNGFDGFEPHTIYIKVEMNDILNKLHSMLIELFRFQKHDFIPHITIARELKYQQYMQAIEIYKKKQFEDLFRVDRLLLLKKQDGPYKRVKEFYLRSPEN